MRFDSRAQSDSVSSMLLTLEKVSASTWAMADTDGTESTSAGPDSRPATWLAMVPPVAITRTRGCAPAAGHTRATARAPHAPHAQASSQTRSRVDYELTGGAAVRCAKVSQAVNWPAAATAVVP